MEQPILSIQAVGFKAGQETILENISFDVEKGEIVTITGPSGSGKSTLLKVLGSLISPTKGEILFKGQSVDKNDPLEYRKKVSYFFQNAALFDQTVKDNLTFPYEIRNQDPEEQRIKDYLKKVKLPETYYEKAVTELSGGEKQRVALVRNLLFQPEVLLLDEVTSSLDTEKKRIIHTLINELNQQSDITVLMITHDESELSQADRVIQIIDGRLEEKHDE